MTVLLTLISSELTFSIPNHKTQTQQQSTPHHHSEEILAVRRSKLFQQTPAWHGVNKDAFDSFVDTIETHATFIPRAHAETNPDYKQVIPYLVFKFEDKFFVMQRKNNASGLAAPAPR